MDIPRTQYASSGNINIAYQVLGQGSDYLIFIPGWISNVEAIWQNFHFAAWIRSLAYFTKIVLFDKRGTGLSDRVDESKLPDIAQRAEDLNQIMDSLNIKKCSILGLSEGGALGIYFTAKHPEKVDKLINDIPKLLAEYHKSATP